MYKGILRLGFLTAVTLGFFAALPYVSNTNVAQAGDAPRSCANCKQLSDKWNKKLKCPGFRLNEELVQPNTDKKSTSGKVFGRDQAKNAFPGCADKVRVKVKCNTCYEINFKGQWDYNCNTPRSNEHQITDVLFQLPNAYNKNKLQTVDGKSFQRLGYFTFNDKSVRSSSLKGPNQIKVDDTYKKPEDPKNGYTFYYWSDNRDNIEMYIKEYPCKKGSCKKYGHQNYLDNSGKISYTVKEVDQSKCAYCPDPAPQDPAPQGN